MKPLLRVQVDLFASPVRPPELIGSERQKAVALLRALLMEAAIYQADVPASSTERASGNE
jgi:predicted ABC-type transport system involved in lysophospholipase L1 biosynthesis ATPase subunit